jgi:hypothetical protein
MVDKYDIIAQPNFATCVQFIVDVYRANGLSETSPLVEQYDWEPH